MLPFGRLLGGSAPFRDDFNRADQSLEASANWPLLGGASGALVISGNRLAHSSTPSLRAVYAAPRRNSAFFYTQALVSAPTGGNGPFIAAYIVDANNWIGYRSVNGSLARTEMVTGADTDFGLGGGIDGKTLRVEVDTAAGQLKVFADGVLLRTDTFPGGIAKTGRSTGVARLYDTTTFFLDNFLTEDL